MGYNSNLTKKRNAAINPNKEIHSSGSRRIRLIGQILRVVGVVGILASVAVVASTGSLFFGLLMLLSWSAFTLPIVPIVLLVVGQVLILYAKMAQAHPDRRHPL